MQFIRDLEDPTDDHVDSGFSYGRWLALQSELGEEWCPSIERLVHRLAVLTIAVIVCIVDMLDINVDEPDSALNVFLQRPSGLTLPLQHTPRAPSTTL